MALWPENFPPPLVSGYQIEPVDPTVRSDMEVGAARQRQISAARNDHVPVVFKFSDELFGEFRTWYDANKTSWISGLSLALGGGITTPDCRFIPPWTARPISGNLFWLVTAKLEVR